jgi:radical SAM superfamily enzyme YgiQ (UPF0313 family)
VETFRVGTSTLVPPLGLAYIAGAIEAQGYSVTLIDSLIAAPLNHTPYFQGYLLGISLSEVAARIPADAKAVGITCMFTHEWPMVVQLVKLIKALRPELPVVVGGEHVTAIPEFSLATSQVDALVLGEGEETAAELFVALVSGNPIDEISGIAFQRDGEIFVNKRRARRRQIDEIARPSWHLFDLEAYHDNRFVGGVYSEQVTVPMLATRGCPYQCTYCSSPNMWTTRWIPRDPKEVADEIESYIETYGAGNFPFYDLTAVIQKKWIVDFCNEIIDRGLDITWQLASGTRSEAIDEEVAALLNRAGMINMAYAPESGSDRTRRFIRKRVTGEKLNKSIAAAASADLSVAAYMVIGFPHDGRQEMRETLDFLRDIAKRGVNDLGSGYYSALPGTELFRTLYENGDVVIDREYFRHILNGLSIYPATSFSYEMSRAELFYWKIRFVAAFYWSRARVLGLKTVFSSIQEMMSNRTHHSKLQTALRVSILNGYRSIKVKFKPRWMSMEEETALFAPWDDIYRKITMSRRAAGIEETPVTDSRDLEDLNVINALKLDHDVARSLRIADSH